MPKLPLNLPSNVKKGINYYQLKPVQSTSIISFHSIKGATNINVVTEYKEHTHYPNEGKPSEPFTHENIDDDYKIHQRIVSDIVNMDANPAPVHLTDIFGVYSRQNIFKGRGLKKDARLNSVLQLRPDYTYIFIEDRVSYDLAKKDHKVVQFVVKGKFTINKKLVNSEIEQIIDFEKGEIFVEHTTGYIISLRPTSPNASGGGVFIGSLGLVSSGELFYDLTNPRGTPRTGFTGYTAKKFIKTK